MPIINNVCNYFCEYSILTKVLDHKHLELWGTSKSELHHASQLIYLFFEQHFKLVFWSATLQKVLWQFKS